MVAPIRPGGVPLAEFLNSAKIGANKPAAGAPSTEGVGESQAADFTGKLREALNEANSTQKQAETAAADYASGKQNDLHGTMITMAQADISLRLVSNVRNRVIEAYREVMRMGS
jgi:flagellar hook-basal body complex protein FliE